MPDPPAFASAEDLGIRLGITLTDDETTRATALLERASNLVRDATKNPRQTISQVDDDALTMRGTRDERIPLPEKPVTEVTSVSLDGNPISGWYVDGNVLVRTGYPPPNGIWPRYGNIGAPDSLPFVLDIGGFGYERQVLEIVYTHGYEDGEIPELVRTITLEAVVRVWVNPGAVARESIGNVSTVYDNMRFSPTGLLLSDAESKAIRRFFGRRAQAVQIGS